MLGATVQSRENAVNRPTPAMNRRRTPIVSASRPADDRKAANTRA